MQELLAKMEQLSPEKRELILRKLQQSHRLTPTDTNAGPTAIPRAPRTTALPLSYAQQRLWVLDQLEREMTAYNMPVAIRLDGRLHLPALEYSLREIVRRHEALRTTFQVQNDLPIQVISDAATLPIEKLSLVGQSEAAQEATIAQMIEAEVARPFNLAVGPMLRVTLVTLNPTTTVLIATMHHIVSDSWSMGVLIQEWMRFYQAYITEQSAALPPLTVQYADYAVWQRERIEGAQGTKELNFWRQKLSDAPPLLDLPTDHTRPTVQRYRGAVVQQVLSPAVTNTLRGQVRAQNATLYAALLGTFAHLMARYSRTPDVVIGTPVAGRVRRDLEPLIGFFVNTLALRLTLAPDLTFESLIRMVQEESLQAFAHQELPFERLVELLQPERNLSYSPLFQVMFVLQNAPATQLELPGLRLNVLPLERGAAKFDLTLVATETNGGVELRWEYNRDLFDAATIERMAGHYNNLLEGMVTAPRQPIAALPLMDRIEYTHVVNEWNATTVPYNTSVCFHTRFEAQAARTPHAIAVRAGNLSLTYAELNRRANQLAHHLQSLGVGPDVLVGICVERSLPLLIGILATLKAGGGYIPLDSTYPADRLNFMVEDARVRVVLTQKRLRRHFRHSTAEVVLLSSKATRIDPFTSGNPYSPVTADNLAYVIYTSGSTGKPKGVMIEHHALMNYLDWALDRYPFRQGASLVHTSISFDATITSLLAPLLVGQTVELIPEQNEIEHLCQALRQPVAYSVVKITPAHLDILNHLLPFEEIHSRIGALVIGGEQLNADTLRHWRQHKPDTELINEYGPTETVVGCCIYAVRPNDPTTGAIAIGRPIANTQLYVLDAHRQPVPLGVPGELYIGGAGVARGYLHRPDLTRDRFVPDPFATLKRQEETTVGLPLSKLERGQGGEVKMYKTGNLVRLRPDGEMVFLGRLDHQVKIRGYRIELGEIESALLQQPQVAEAIVRVRTSAPGGQQLAAFVVPASSITANDLRAALAAQLPTYMVPADMTLLDRFPLTPNGKVDVYALLAMTPAAMGAADTYEAPHTPTQEIIASIWRDILNRERVGIHDNFFALGGHSLLATQALSRLRGRVTFDVPLRLFFECPTIAEFAARLDVLQNAVQQMQAQVWDEDEEREEIAL